MIVERCVEGQVSAIAADPPPLNFVIGVTWEWPKSLYYLTLNRGC
jgi:hypothetical protein